MTYLPWLSVTKVHQRDWETYMSTASHMRAFLGGSTSSINFSLAFLITSVHISANLALEMTQYRIVWKLKRCSIGKEEKVAKWSGNVAAIQLMTQWSKYIGCTTSQLDLSAKEDRKPFPILYKLLVYVFFKFSKTFWAHFSSTITLQVGASIHMSDSSHLHHGQWPCHNRLIRTFLTTFVLDKSKCKF